MKTLSYLLVWILLSLLILPQAYSQFYNFGYWPYQSRPCPWDSTQTLNTSQNWDVYQTQNDKWDGPVDSSRCINIFSAQINLSDIDPAKPIFIRYKMPVPNFHVLWPNQLYVNRYEAPSLSGNATFLLSDTTCPNQQCTGMRLGIEIPDSAGTGTDIRWYSGNFSRDPFTFETGFCFPSEKFANQVIKELFFRIQIDRFDSTSILRMPEANIEEHVFFQQITFLSVPNNPPASPAFQLSGQYLMLHNDSTYPGPNNPFYIDVTLQPPASQQKTIFLNIDPFGYLTGQPFTELRGDTVTGGNGTRHQVVIVNRGGTMCFSFLEVVFRQGNGFRHEAGKLAFQHASACMAFHEGSFLEVGQGATLKYGEDGLGVMLLKEGAEIRLEKQSELRIANRVVLDAISEDGNVHIYLPPGRKLSFTKSAQILVGSKSANPNAKLVVHLRGGELDENELAISSKQRIELINEPFLQPFEDAKILYGTNGKDPILSFFLDENIPVELAVYDLNGRLLWKKGENLNQGPHRLTIPTTGLEPAIYLIRVGNGERTSSRKFWVR